MLSRICKILGSFGCDIRFLVSQLLRIMELDIMFHGSTSDVAQTLQGLQEKSAMMQLVMEAVNE